MDKDEGILLSYKKNEAIPSAATWTDLENVALLSSSVLSDSATPWTVAHQAPLSMGILQARMLESVAFPLSRRAYYVWWSKSEREREMLSCYN